MYIENWKLKQYTENLSAKLQNSNQNSTFSWVTLMSRLNPHFDLQNDHLLRSPTCNTQIQQRKRGGRFSKLFCHAVIDANLFLCLNIWRYICYSKHALSKKPSFLRHSGFPAGHAFKNLQSSARKKM